MCPPCYLNLPSTVLIALSALFGVLYQSFWVDGRVGLYTCIFLLEASNRLYLSLGGINIDDLALWWNLNNCIRYLCFTVKAVHMGRLMA